MNHDLICQWLDLPAGSWPPDHYTLLSLAPREADSRLIETRIHERMMRIRPYQLNHPDEATEVLNRLAAAFNCLTDPAAKQTYDASDLSRPPAPLERELGKREVIDPSDPLAWLFGPWNRLSAPLSPNGPPADKGEGSHSSQQATAGSPSERIDIRHSRLAPSIARVGEIRSWILQHPGFSLLALGLLALLMTLIRHWRR
jgi:hypothetical protein